MSRHPFGWDLPPGVTQRKIDEAAGGYDDEPPEQGDFVELTEERVLNAMSVVPIAWLTTADIVGEMNVEADSREIIPILKRLLSKNLVIKSERPKHQATEWCLSDEMAAKVIEEYDANHR